mmetsp:Transcript_39318/g.112222  ORF Transcript_39318/g.112222 Transcript_39318/m.112222 type:complete len:207 (+) Transcript_39318:372-992(+)
MLRASPPSARSAGAGTSSTGFTGGRPRREASRVSSSAPRVVSCSAVAVKGSPRFMTFSLAFMSASWVCSGDSLCDPFCCFSVEAAASASLDCFALSSTAFAAFMASSTLPFSIADLAAWMAASFNFPNSRALFVLRTECWQKRLPLAVFRTGSSTLLRLQKLLAGLHWNDKHCAQESQSTAQPLMVFSTLSISGPKFSQPLMSLLS